MTRDEAIEIAQAAIDNRVKSQPLRVAVAVVDILVALGKLELSEEQKNGS